MKLSAQLPKPLTELLISAKSMSHENPIFLKKYLQLPRTRPQPTKLFNLSLPTQLLLNSPSSKLKMSSKLQEINRAATTSTVHHILSSNPKQAHSALKRLKSTLTSKISEIKVDDKTYHGDKVATGFYYNMKNLKTMKPETKNFEACQNFKFDYELIKEISKAGDTIPKISIEKAEELLHSLKPNVFDHFSISALHYINGGPLAIKHFQLIFNLAIDDIENTTCEELNNAHACILYKGHSKDKTLAGCYRTISTCPFVAKSLDYYIRDISIDDWHAAIAETHES